MSGGHSARLAGARLWWQPAGAGDGNIFLADADPPWMVRYDSIIWRKMQNEGGPPPMGLGGDLSAVIPWGGGQECRTHRVARSDAQMVGPLLFALIIYRAHGTAASLQHHANSTIIETVASRTFI